MKLAGETNSAMPALCDELAVLLVNETNIKPKISYFKGFNTDTETPYIPVMLANCTKAEEENGILLTNANKRVTDANNANDKAMTAAENCVTAILDLTSDYDTHKLWLNTQNTLHKFK